MSLKQIILVLEDDFGIAESLSMLLEYHDYQVILSTAENLFDDLAQHSPYFILLDVRPGSEQGDNICRKIKSDRRYNRIPLYLFSALPNLSSVAQASGADGYISKPYDIDYLVAIIREEIAKRSTD